MVVVLDRRNCWIYADYNSVAGLINEASMHFGE